MSGAGLTCSMLACRLLGMLVNHNQIPLHKTLSNLVFTSHCICFYYIMICPVSSAYTIGVTLFAWHWYIGCWLWTGHCFGYLFSGYLFPVLFANQILICFMSAAHVSPGFCRFHLRCVSWLSTGHCSGFIVSGTVCQLDIDLFNVASLVHWDYIEVQFWFNGCYFEQVTVSIQLFFNWVLCIYIFQKLPYFVCFWFE